MESKYVRSKVNAAMKNSLSNCTSCTQRGTVSCATFLFNQLASVREGRSARPSAAATGNCSSAACIEQSPSASSSLTKGAG